MVKAVLFDLDDTLISERQYIKSGFFHIAGIVSERHKIPIKKITIDLMDLFDECPKNVFNRLLDLYKIKYTTGAILDLVDKYRNHLPEIQFYDDVIPCIQHLKLMNVKVGIVTDGYANVQLRKLISVNAYNYFDEIILTDELGREFWKPHSKAFEIAKMRLGLKYDEMIYVGDNPQKDFYVRKILPIKTVRIFRKGIYKDAKYRENVREDYSINSLDELKAIINNRDH